MKNSGFKLILLFSLFAVSPVHSQGNNAVNVNTGYLSIGGNFPLVDNYNQETSVNLLNIGMENKAINAGFEFSPVRLFAWSSGNEYAFNEHTGCSFFNVNAYWNVLSLLNDSLFFGPNTSFNYLFVDEIVHWNQFIYSLGVQFGLRIASHSLQYNIFVAEMGYRNISGNSKYFVGVKVDLAAIIIGIILASASRAETN